MGPCPQPLVRTTLEVMRQAGIQVEAAADLLDFVVPGGQAYRAGEYWVNGDYPSSAAILAAAAVTGGAVTVRRLFEDSQGERAVVQVLRQMGVELLYDGCTRSACWASPAAGHRVRRRQGHGHGPGRCWRWRPVPRAAVAFYGIGNLRLKECDRIAVPVQQFGAPGCGLHRRTGRDCGSWLP